jgi:hypothetical protein
MGLDMYLFANRHMSKFRDDESEIMDKVLGVFPELEGYRGGEKYSSLGSVSFEITVGYWRKANHIHRWFLNNCARGEEDNCQRIYVSREKLEELRDTCRRVLEFRHLAENQLPTQEGFFFGGTSYDEYYYSENEHTIKVIEEALKLPEGYIFYYQASW